MKTHTFGNTEFKLAFSTANNTWVFTRVDGGYPTETTVLEGSKKDAEKYYDEKVDFYRVVAGV